ncbi:MAG: hypothetical protein M3285_09145 [Actinomycetota bacterium]|nr:hypothetical protein [Actinomycetota bacterium]
MYSGQDSYADAVKWIRSARRGRSGGWQFAERAFGASLMAGIPILCVIALLSPTSFGAPGSNTLRSGWPLYLLLGILGLSLLLLIASARYVRWTIARLRDPFVRSFSGDARFEGAADALAECPAPLRTRFAMGWVWGPTALAVLGIFGTFSCAYFLIDAVMARFEVGLGHPILAAINGAVGLIAFRLGAARLQTWRLAVSVHRTVRGDI